jgi:hypothetical protein
MMKSVPLSLADWRSIPKTLFVEVCCDVAFIAFVMPDLRLVILPGLFSVVHFICGHVRRSPIGGFASSNMISGRTSPSKTALAAESTVSLYSISVCDLTLPMCV